MVTGLLVMLLLLLLQVVALHGAGCPDPGAGWTGQAVVDASIDYTVQWKVVTQGADKYLELALSGRTGGWLGFGFGEKYSGSMLGADIVTVSVDESSCEVNVDDWYVPWASYPFSPYTGGPENPYPVLDTDNGGCADWQAVSGSQQGGCTRAVIRRKLASGDSGVFDRDIVLGENNRVLWAHGSSDAMSYHGPRRGTLSINFESNNARESDEVLLQKVLDECGDSCFTYDLQIDNYEIPEQTTSYMCQGFDVDTSAFGPEGVHLVGFFTVVDNAPFVHHLIVHTCYDDAYFASHLNNPSICGGTSLTGTSPLGTDCQSLIYAWAVGGEPVLLPSDAGVPVSTTVNRRILIEVHYNNPSNLVGQRDSSALRVVATPNKRAHDAAVLVVGDPKGKNDKLPARQPIIHRVGECSSECTSASIPENEVLNVFAVFPHMHAFGKQMWTNVYDKNMNFKTTITELDFWNFEFQSTFTIDPIQIEPGDSLFTHCRFDTTTQSQDVIFGIDSLDEMCMDFLYVWPVRNAPDGEPWTLCGQASSFGDTYDTLNPPLSKEEILGFKPHYRDTGFGSLCNSDVLQGYTETISFGGLTANVPVNRRDDRVWDDVQKAYVRQVTFATPSGSLTCDPNSNGSPINASACNPTTPPPNPSSQCSGDSSYPFQIEPLDGLQFCWKEPVVGPTQECTLQVRLQTDGERWISIGLGEEMTGSVAVIADQNGVAEHSIASRSQSAITELTDANGIVNFQFDTSATTSVLQLTLRSIGGQGFNACNNQVRSAAAVGDALEAFIFAIGSSKSFGYHETATAAVVDLQSGLSQDAPPPTAKDMYLQMHAFLMAIVFAILMPLLVIMPLMKNHWTKNWFILHRAIATLAFTCTAVALALAVLYTNTHLSETHHFVGVAAVAALCINPMLGLMRPHKQDPRRPTWLLLHRCFGYGALFAGFGAILLGAKLIQDKNLPEFFGEKSFIAAAILVTVGLTILITARLRSYYSSTKPNKAVTVMDKSYP